MLLHVKSLCVIILTVLRLNSCLSDEIIGCEGSDFQEAVNTEPLDLAFNGDIITFPDVKMTSILSTKNNNFREVYVSGRLENVDDRTDLIIYTTENFERYTKEQTSTSIIVNVNFTCSGGSTRILLFSQPLKDGNYFPPEFSQDLYTFVIPTPLYKGFELTTFEEISAMDYDLSGYEIRFSSTDSEEFNILVGTLGKQDKKTSFASLKLMSIILSLNEKIEFSITATDSGNPPRSSTPAKVIITADSSNSLPPIPHFLETVVYGSLTDDLKLSELEIVLDPATYSSDVTFRKLSDDEDIFEINNIENVVSVTLARELDLEFIKGRERLTFDIEASNNRLTDTGRIGVLISFPHKKESRFKMELYKGKLFVKSNTLEIEDFEVLVDEGELGQLNYELQGQQVDLFDIEHDQNIVRLFLKPNLGADMWTNINYVSLKLLAKKNSDEIASTNIIVDVIHSTLSFQKPAYIGSINSDGDLVLDPVVLLTSSNSMDDIDIQLLQTDAQLFSYTITDNQIILKLKENTNQVDLQNKNYLSLKIEAKETSTGLEATCLVFIGKPIVKSVVKFEKNIYEAQINSEAELIAEDVVLDKDSYNNEIEFSLLGRDAEYFSFQQNDNRIVLALKDNFSVSNHYDLNALWIELKAVNTKESLEASTVVVFAIAREATPEFEEHNYIGELTQDNALSLAKLVLRRSTWKSYTLIELTGEYSDLFGLTVTENQVEISLKSDLPEEVQAHNSIVLVVIASNNGIKGYATVVINLLKSRNLTNIFKKTIQKGKILMNENVQELKIDDVELVKEYNVADFTCKLSGDESKSLDFTVIAPKNVIKLILAAELPTEVMEKIFYLTFLLECESKEDVAIAGSTIIFIDLPGLNGQHGCPTPEPPTFIPEFQNYFYNFYAKPSYVGSLQSVHAVIKGSDADVRYSLNVKNDHLRSRTSIDSTSGEIFLTAITSPGRYYFDIVAENVITHGQSQAKGRLDVEALIQCEDHVSVSNALLIKYLEEETEHDAILNTKLENCEFYIFSLEPDNQEYVKIDPATKMLTMIRTDREDLIFSNMVPPQIEVKLKLDCSSDRRSNFNPIRRFKRDLDDSMALGENRSLILTNDILFSKDVTILSILLVDINDNHPEFVYPKQERLVVGFPEGEIAMQIFSEHVIQVVALDKDEGLNAKIRYSIQPNEHFQIDPSSGEVYPFANAMKEINEIDLTVYATDKDGASDGLSSKFTLTVKVLSAEHFTLLTFVSETVSDIEKLLENARTKTGINFVEVKHATVSSTTTNDARVFRAGSVQFVQKVWTYAFDGDVPISSKDIKRKLTEDNSDISAQTFEEVLAVTEGIELSRVQSVTGYIVGLCVLAVIIVACFGFIAWRYIYRNRSHIHDEPGNNLSSRSPTNPNFNLKQGAEINIQKQTEILSDTPYEPSFYSKRESVKILGTTTQESTDDGRRRQLEKINSTLNGSLRENNDGNDSDSSNESSRPRATVTFNELVERIHIESDDDEKNKL